MTNVRGVRNGARDVILRAMQNCGGGFVTEELLKRATGVGNRNTFHSHIFKLRQMGHDVQRVPLSYGVRGYRLNVPQTAE